MSDKTTEHLIIRALGGPYGEVGTWGLLLRQENTATYLGQRPLEGYVWRIDTRSIPGDDAVVEIKTDDGAVVGNRVVQPGETLGVFEAITDTDDEAYGVLAQLALAGMDLTARDESTRRELILLLYAAAADESWTFDIGANRYKLTNESRESLRQIARELESGKSASTAQTLNLERSCLPSVAILGHPHTVA